MVTAGGTTRARRALRVLGIGPAAVALVVAAAPLAGAQAPTAEAVEPIARELLDGLTARVGGTTAVPGRYKVAIRPFPEDEIGVSAAVAERHNDALLSALLKLGGDRFSFMARSQLNAVIEEISAMGELEEWRTNPVAALLRNARVDVLVIGKIRRAGQQFELSYEAIGVADGKAWAATTPRRIALAPNDAGPPRAVLSLDRAVRNAARHFREYASDMTELRLGGIRYQNSGRHTRLGQYIEESLADAIGEAFLDVLSNRRLVVGRAELSRQRLDEMRGAAVDSAGMRRENFDRRAGVYVLTGNYWDFGSAVELRLKLRDARGSAVPWRRRFRAETVPAGLPLRPPGDFAKLRENDGRGPIRFDLSSARGKDPKYRIGDRLDLLVRTGVDAWLYCFYLQADGSLVKIFPNAGHKDPKIRGRRLHTIPGALFNFDMTVSEPAGVELIKCFAVSRDVTADLPPVLRRLEFGADRRVEPLPRGMEWRLSGIFRRPGDVRLTEASLVVTVSR